MKQIFIIFMLLIICHWVYSQESYFVEGKDYSGYVFYKEHSIGGFPPESNRYTLTQEDIVRTEAILKKNINSKYVKSCQLWWDKPPINKQNLKKYCRQYVGYLNSNNEVIVRVFLIMMNRNYVNELSNDIIFLCDGGYSYWTIAINLKTRKVFDMMVNGES